MLQGQREGGVGERAEKAGLPEEGSRGEEEEEGQELGSSCHLGISNGQGQPKADERSEEACGCPVLSEVFQVSNL